MLRFLVRRALLVVPSLLGLMVLSFVLLRVVPTDPAAALAGENATPAQVQEIRHQYGLDRPVIEQFVIYVRQVLSGDLGRSIFSNRPVVQDIGQRIPATLELTFVALAISTIIGIPLGTLAAVTYNSPVDHAVRVFTVAGLAIASFWLAIMFQILFAMDLDWLPLRGRFAVNVAPPSGPTGFFLIDSLLSGDMQRFWITVRHLAMPAITLAIPGLATIARFTRSGVIETMQRDFVHYARAMGYGRFRLVSIYVLRNSVVAAITQIGLLFGVLISSAVAVEAIFDWPGLGSFAVMAILNSDYKAVLAVTLFVGVIYAIVNILVDVVHGLIDPRVAEQL